MTDRSGKGRLGRLLLLAAGLALLAWLGTTCVWVVERSEEGVVLRMGRVARVVPAGIHLTLPWPLETFHRVSTSEVRTLSVGFEEGTPRPAENQAHWLTADTNIVELRFQVQYVVVDPARWLFGVAQPTDGTKDEIVGRLAETVVSDLVVRTPIDDVLSVGKAKLQSDARAALQRRAEDLGLGLSIVAINIAEAAPPAPIRAAFIDVSSAEADRQRVLSEADGFSRDLLPTERARANRLRQEAYAHEDQVVNAARGTTESFLALAREVEASPEISRQRLWLQAVREVLSRGEILVYPEGERAFRVRLFE